MGNNAIPYYKNNISNVASQNFEESFIYEEDPSADPIDSGNKNLAIVNAFYISNALHDITYKYGFTEQAYNFQHTQIAAGGQGNDRVKISVQDRTGTNNANFAAPPDGQPGQMRMYTWDLTSPRRDGALENDIIVHEYTHGISNRLTGKSVSIKLLRSSTHFNFSCLQAEALLLAYRRPKVVGWERGGRTFWPSGLSKSPQRPPTTPWDNTCPAIPVASARDRTRPQAP
jgi:hypothetical protein